jgi:hypothetical protein
MDRKAFGVPTLKAMKNGFVYWLATLQMLDYDSLEQFRSHARVPHAVGVNDHDRALAANTEAWSLSAFHPTRTKKKAFPIQKIRKQ